MEFKTLTFDLQETKQEEINGQKIGIIKGHAAAFSKDLVNDIIEPGAFFKTIAEHKSRHRLFRMKFQHKRDEIIGGFPSEKAFEDGKGLFVEGQINLQVQKGVEAFSLAKQGVLTDLSIGFGIPEGGAEFDSDTGIRRLKVIDLSEISIVDEPANRDATITDVKTVVPLADHDRPWDKSQAIERVRRFTDSVEKPSKEYRNAFMWFDSENADDFDAYKFLYADVVNGRLMAVPKGLFAVRGALTGACGGGDIPQHDQEQVKKNVTRYFEKMGLEDPFKSNFLIVSDIKNLKDVNTYLKELGLSNKERNILVSRIKNTEKRDAVDPLAHRDDEPMGSNDGLFDDCQFLEKLTELNNIMKEVTR